MNDECRYISSLASLDVEYRFGQPKLYLAPHELARLTILRSTLGDTQADRAAERTRPVNAWRGTRDRTVARAQESSASAGRPEVHLQGPEQ
jgi:hypothetical protein